MASVVKDSGEGRYFFVAGWCDGSCKKCCPEATGKRVGCAAFLHNVIIVHTVTSFGLGFW
ncbi:hypothetical protein SAMN05444377_11457 [Flavobacterium fontis]|uniref:Uncharacterized protein n=1 Tax=Flavobacterium fontis TaxID=1124188 RepID=A0A1M5DA87_9FLAO|nr:MAG: hypothetical protein CUR32_03055 [Flavobacterium sp.] [Flavobacterium sp. FEMGT703F]SHF63795.1 hypothetical protein SAMN05444377_11457 [Flavobacterium fontis]